MKIASVAEIKAQFSAFLKASEGGPVVVTRNGRPVAVIVGVQDEDEIERLLMAYSPHLRTILDRSRRQFQNSGRLLDIETAEKPHLHNTAFAGIELGERVERLVQRDDIRAPVCGYQYRLFEDYMLGGPAPLTCSSFAGKIH